MAPEEFDGSLLLPTTDRLLTATSRRSAGSFNVRFPPIAYIGHGQSPDFIPQYRASSRTLFHELERISLFEIPCGSIYKIASQRELLEAVASQAFIG
jgi:hypothetical protein